MTIFRLESVGHHLARTGTLLPRQAEALRYLDKHLKTDPEALAILQEATMIWRTPEGTPISKPKPPSQPGQPPLKGKPTAIGREGTELVKHFEQCHTKIGGGKVKAYMDPVGIPTIGYGHTKGVRMGQVITLAQAEQILIDDLNIFSKGVIERVRVELTQGQYDALVSFAFNVGLGALKQSTLLRLLNQGKYDAAAREFPRWCKAGGRKLEGLERRRFAERFLFLGKDWTVFKDTRTWKQYKDM